MFPLYSLVGFILEILSALLDGSGPTCVIRSLVFLSAFDLWLMLGVNCDSSLSGERWWMPAVRGTGPPLTA